MDSVKMGRMGGLERAKRLKPARRKAIARKAALARWSKKGKRRAGGPGVK